MSAAESLQAKAERLRAARSAPTEVSTSVPTDVSTSVRTVRTRPVRLTVDVSPADHAGLRRLCLELTEATGVNVTGQLVLETLLQSVLHEPVVRQYISRSVGQS